MTYQFSKADIDESRTLPGHISLSKKEIGTERAKRGLPSQAGSLESFGAGVANPLLAALNLAPEALGKLTGKKIPEIPYVPYSEGFPHLAGEVLGFAAPFGGAARGVGMAARGAEKVLPALAKIPGLLRGLAGGSTAGAAAGFAGTPASEGRGAGATGGALGGLAGAAIPEILASALSPLRKIKEFMHTREGFLGERPIKLPEKAHDDLVNDIVSHYGKAASRASTKYRNLWEKIGAEGIPKEYMKHVAERMEKEQTKYGEPFYDLNDSEDFPRTESGDISPQDLHYKKGEVFNRSKSFLETTSDKVRNKKFYGAIKNDLEDFLNKKGVLDEYKNAGEDWKKELLPYKNSNRFAKVLKSAEKVSMPAEGKNISNEHIYSLLDNAQTSKLADQFLPKGVDRDIGKFKDLQNLLGGSKEEAQIHLKNMVLSKFVDGDGDMDFGGFLKYVEGKKGTAKKGLSTEQKNYIFDKDERAQLRKAASLYGKDPRNDNVLFRTIAAIMGGHIHPAVANLSSLGAETLTEKIAQRIPRASRTTGLLSKAAKTAGTSMGVIGGQDEER